jgi:hypothetical protein
MHLCLTKEVKGLSYISLTNRQILPTKGKMIPYLKYSLTKDDEHYKWGNTYKKEEFVLKAIDPNTNTSAKVSIFIKTRHFYKGLILHLASYAMPNKSDYIEIMNVSDKLLNLEGVKIVNADKQDESTIEGDILLEPGDIIAISEDTSSTIEDYLPTDYYLIKNNLPAFNLDMGNVSIALPNDTILDSFDYTEDIHFALIDDTEGVSLERISFEVATNDGRNWQSASQNSRFATPGYENSGALVINPTDDMFTIATETFSPNQDGDQDVMILNYNLDKSGFVANISVYDAAGFKIQDLSRNEFLSTQGIITWDGTDADGNISDLGIYVLVGSIFHPDGEVFEFKKTTVLAGFID